MSFFNTNDPHWTKNQKLLLRFFTFYFIIQVVPLDWKFYRELFSIKWSAFNFYDLFSLTRYSPVFFSFTGYANWAIAALIAILATVFYSFVPKTTGTDDNKVYYLLRALLRYRLAAGVIAYGLIKLFPLQMPYPSLSNLHTNYGDFLPWKIYFHTLGIAQPYESFLGAVEVFAGILLLFRRTTTFGAGIIIDLSETFLAPTWPTRLGSRYIPLILRLLRYSYSFMTCRGCIIYWYCKNIPSPIRFSWCSISVVQS